MSSYSLCKLQELFNNIHCPKSKYGNILFGTHTCRSRAYIEKRLSLEILKTSPLVSHFFKQQFKNMPLLVWTTHAEWKKIVSGMCRNMICAIPWHAAQWYQKLRMHHSFPRLHSLLPPQLTISHGHQADSFELPLVGMPRVTRASRSQ